ncbi:MerR family transcriptional regulator [Kocuria rosea]|uniref:MerR family transcriptional regulator n=1 Tax=Kocuria rosea TaxID=1275 RepID=UPI002B24C656|nr:MerR family transcriptional regulator [Kocuria rosea]MEB2529067.1 MerR family transcriptional regulator [Kocuria rosea]MEB2619258.1 MerR family transcriptional regulator [Kocuria rosea]
MEWTVHELAARAGISGRALRHYHRIGLLDPDRVGSNGYRYYGPDAVARLQRILLLRDMGMPLAQMAAVLDAPSSPAAEVDALLNHLHQLTEDRDALDRRIRAVEHTVQMRREGRQPQMDVMLEGFNDRYEDEVVRRWGREAFDASNRWWHAKSIDQQRDWKARAEALLHRWAELHAVDEAPDSPAAQEHAATHVVWFAEIPGTPTHAGDREQSVAMICGMAAMYETSPDFHHTFGSPQAAQLAAAALRIHVQRTWPDATCA